MSTVTSIDQHRLLRIAKPGFYGAAGEIVRAIEPCSEADPNGLLVQLLVAVGNAIGPSPYYQVEATHHHTNMFAVMVGDTAKARKGTSWGWIQRLMREADIGWIDCIKNGCVSGEGIIYNVRDDDESPPDRRLMLVEGEFAQVLKVSRREGNTLSPILRNGWDGGTLATLAKNSPLKSTGSHVSMVGHITEDELLRYLDATEVANGLGNRFLWVQVHRARQLPHGGNYTDEALNLAAKSIRGVLMEARKGGRLLMDSDAKKTWERIYADMANCPAGMIGALTARSEAQTLRLAMLYALLDKSAVITSEHLLAAEAVWRYCDKSVRNIFGTITGDRVADKIKAAIDLHGELSRTAIRDLGNRHWKTAEIDTAINLLVEDYNYEYIRKEGAGRHGFVLRASS